MRHAFDSMSTHQNAIPFLRSYAEQTRAHAMLMITLKSQVAYPQVWKRKDKPWPYGDTPGYFVQLDTCDSADRRVWFIEILEKDGATTYSRHMLDEHYYGIIQPVLKDHRQLPSKVRDFAADRAAASSSAVAAVAETAVPAEDFEAAESFAGAKPGWVYKGGPNGVGYYKDK